MSTLNNNVICSFAEDGTGTVEVITIFVMLPHSSDETLYYVLIKAWFVIAADCRQQTCVKYIYIQNDCISLHPCVCEWYWRVFPVSWIKVLYGNMNVNGSVSSTSSSKGNTRSMECGMDNMDYSCKTSCLLPQDKHFVITYEAAVLVSHNVTEISVN